MGQCYDQLNSGSDRMHVVCIVESNATNATRVNVVYCFIKLYLHWARNA